MKSVIIHDKITEFAGSEMVLESIHQIIPSPIHTLFCDTKALKGTQLEHATIYTTFLQTIPHVLKVFRNLLPLFVFAIETINIRHYDLVITSSHSVAKNVLTFPHQFHICYCHTPMRYAWDLYFEYMENMGYKKFIFAPLMNYIRLWDKAGSERVDLFVANSQHTQKRIKKFYGRDAIVLYPPVEVTNLTNNTQKEDYYVTIARFVPYKRVDIIVKAFNRMTDKKLIVIGEGPEGKRLRRIAGENIVFTGYLDRSKLMEVLAKAKGFVFAAEEDFGIAPVEAQACGIPVIAFGRGGVLETVIDGKTGLFFYEQTEEAIIDAIEKVEKETFDTEYIKRHAKQFSKDMFIEGFKEILDKYTGLH
ncbi:MAG: glycosyltransferase [Proteobacteria bacterium]|jgi:glycosyltransferase involved in cell wall biosynthesis|nr:glycosyltransferase [Pseudomonadota bacterium]